MAVHGTLYYGIGDKVIGSIRQDARASLNGRESKVTWVNDPWTGPRLKVNLYVKCRDGNGWRKASSCGSDKNEADSFSSDPWSMSPRYYQEDDSDYWVEFYMTFWADGYSNPNHPKGLFYAPKLTSQYFDCDDDFKAYKCRFRDA